MEWGEECGERGVICGSEFMFKRFMIYGLHAVRGMEGFLSSGLKWSQNDKLLLKHIKNSEEFKRKSRFLTKNDR